MTARPSSFAALLALVAGALLALLWAGRIRATTTSEVLSGKRTSPEVHFTTDVDAPAPALRREEVGISGASSNGLEESLDDPHDPPFSAPGLRSAYLGFGKQDLRAEYAVLKGLIPAEVFSGAHDAAFRRGDFQVVGAVTDNGDGFNALSVPPSVLTKALPFLHSIRQTEDGKVVQTRLDIDSIPGYRDDLERLFWVRATMIALEPGEKVD